MFCYCCEMCFVLVCRCVVDSLVVASVCVSFSCFLLCLCYRIDFFVFFFFSSRRRHTRCLSDWSSDVCSSDLATAKQISGACSAVKILFITKDFPYPLNSGHHMRSWHYLMGLTRAGSVTVLRSEERRVGKECRSRW